MRIEFIYTHQDYRALLKDFAERSPYIKSAEIQGALITFIVLTFLALAAGAIVSSFWMFLIGVIIAGGTSIFQWSNRAVSKQHAKQSFAEKMEGTFGDCAIEIDPEKLTEFWPSGSMSLKWDSIKEIATTQTHTFFMFLV